MLRLIFTFSILLAMPTQALSTPTGPMACVPAKKHIVLKNDTKAALKKGTRIKWSTAHGETGTLKVRTLLKKGKSLKVGISQPMPKTCQATYRLPR
ncbi:MAG: hypothetical protein CMH52_05085 [Myxococcales bacterium]|nr:hypothetical protein [Myxococcales bacterium]